MNESMPRPGTLAMGVFFVLAGFAFLGEALEWWNLRFRHVWPLLLIGFGVSILLSGMGPRREE